MLRTGSYLNRVKLKEQSWQNDSTSALARGCSPKFSGQCYQSLKKFYGATEGAPAHCTHFWLTDAETFPFRPYNFTDLTRLSFERAEVTRPSGRAAQREHLFRSVLSWYPDRFGCRAKQDMYGDASCGTWVAANLGLCGHRSPIELPLSTRSVMP